MNSRYLFGEAWAIAKSGPRHTAAAVALIALAFYVPGLFALVARNLGRLAGESRQPVAVILTLETAADTRAVADRVVQDPGVARVTIVPSAAALERFRRAYPDLGGALHDLGEAPFPPTIEVTLRPTAPIRASQKLAAAARAWPGVDSAGSERPRRPSAPPSGSTPLLKGWPVARLPSFSSTRPIAALSTCSRASRTRFCPSSGSGSWICPRRSYCLRWERSRVLPEVCCRSEKRGRQLRPGAEDPDRRAGARPLPIRGRVRTPP